MAIQSSIFLFALDNTITADVIPAVIERFGQADRISWLSVAFTMGGLTLFLVGSALCGGAPNINAFIIGRVIAGVGGIGMYLGVMTLLSVNTSPTARPMYLGMVGLIFGIGNVVGPVIGDIDFAGIVLSIGAIVCLIMGINFGGTLYDWDSVSIIVLFVVSCAFFIVFAVQQGLALLTTKDNRLFPVVFLFNKEAMLLSILTAAFMSSGFIPIYYIPSYFQFTRGDGALESGVRILPLIILISFTIMVNGGYLSRGGCYMPWYVLGSVLTLIGGVLFWIGVGCGMQTGFAVIQSITAPELMAHGIGFIMIAQLLGVSLALSIGGTVYLNLSINGFQKLLPGTSRTEIQGALQGLSGSFLDSLTAAQEAEALKIMVTSLSHVLLTRAAAIFQLQRMKDLRGRCHHSRHRNAIYTDGEKNRPTMKS
ncbi:MFS general substrate transporter [Aspergillus ellipticus CBS 707.79]|uniref:MFS general substrate transporter n=1 Tax=Aspergillus ellipticus CBS 707.79 TaxID=1448320 RepID=A0A319DMM3_9EURO|nr:MFS general substrate transporter [Aspergillus ellipticus CBS 707.79]